MAEPWKSEALGSGRFRFTNTSGGKLAMVVLSPVSGAEVRVEDGVAEDPHVVPVPVDAGGSFVAVVRGAGVRMVSTVLWQPGRTQIMRSPRRR